MELHIYTGSFNRLYDLGDEILKESQSSFDMGPKHCTGKTRTAWWPIYWQAVYETVEQPG